MPTTAAFYEEVDSTTFLAPRPCSIKLIKFRMGVFAVSLSVSFTSFYSSFSSSSCSQVGFYLLGFVVFWLLTVRAKLSVAVLYIFMAFWIDFCFEVRIGT